MYSSESMMKAFSWFYQDFRPSSLEEFEAFYPSGSVERSYFWKIGNFFDLMGDFLRGHIASSAWWSSFAPTT